MDRDSISRPQGYDEIQEMGRLALGEGSNWELAEAVLGRNAEVLRRFEESSDRPDFQFPAFENPRDWTGVTIAWSPVVQLLSIRVFLRAEKEGVHAGLQDAMKIIRFGHRVETAQGSLIQWMTGSAFKREGLNCVRSLLTKGRLRSEQLVAFGRQLESYGSNREGFVFSTKFEYRFLLGQIDKIASRELDPVDFFFASEEELDKIKGDFDVLRTRREVASVMRSFIDLVTNHKPTWGLGQPLEDYSTLELPFDEHAGTPDFLAKALCHQLTRAWRIGLEEGAMEDAILAATRTHLALKAHKQDTGRLARSLGELVPDYLREIPSDPFDGRPLRFVPSKGIVYSIGADLVDRGGSDKETPVSARQDKNEPTFRIEF